MNNSNSTSTLNIEKFVRASIKEDGRTESRKKFSAMSEYKKEEWPNSVVELVRDIGDACLKEMDKNFKEYNKTEKSL